MSNPWFRMYAEFAHDPKVQMMPEVMQRRYIMLMCMRCSNELVTLQDEEIAFHLRIDALQLAETKTLFIAKGFISTTWELLNWEKRQFQSDKSADRVAKHRAAKKTAELAALAACNDNVTLQKQDCNGLDTDTDTDKELPLSPETGDDIRRCPTGTLVNLYHELMPLNPQVKVVNAARTSAIKARWLEAAKLTFAPFGYTTRAAGLEAWRSFFAICADSPFLTGRAPPQPGKPAFVADIDFLFSPGGFAKILENKYHRDAT